MSETSTLIGYQGRTVPRETLALPLPIAILGAIQRGATLALANP